MMAFRILIKKILFDKKVFIWQIGSGVFFLEKNLLSIIRVFVLIQFCS